MNVRMLSVRLSLFALSLFGAFALWFGAGTATAVTSRVEVECRGWPGRTTVTWDSEAFLRDGYGRVDQVSMSWPGMGSVDYATIDGDSAHATTAIFATSAYVTLHFTYNSFEKTYRVSCPGRESFNY